ncbi:ATP synthase-coupling factor 6, mitochondrial [Clonorchis sinensis]|uniref:ATP synthase-coupling factor 6, mitochondrial n=1 Tax=Clonorchis sinensis TaxID=79923 RepID=A0A8T1LWF7_CLOSI|nr:ATP synthase-coupling factor 6, mitochondrial [Clonorchis sinensis]
MNVGILLRPCIWLPLCRSVTTKAATATQLDAIQKAFVAKIQEYNQKSKTAEMGLANATPAELKELNDMLAKIDKIFGATGQDMTQFPSFKFDPPKLVHPHSAVAANFPEETVVSETDDKPKDDKFILTI